MIVRCPQTFGHMVLFTVANMVPNLLFFTKIQWFAIVPSFYTIFLITVNLVSSYSISRSHLRLLVVHLLLFRQLNMKDDQLFADTHSAFSVYTHTYTHAHGGCSMLPLSLPSFLLLMS